MNIKKPGSALYVIGERKDECGGSAYYEVLEQLLGAPRDALLGASMPQPSFDDVARQMRLVIDASRSGLLLSCHDISDGGMLLALFEMLMPVRKEGGTIGIELDLDALRSPLAADKLLFSQSPGFIVEVPGEQVENFLALGKRHTIEAKRIGTTVASAAMNIRHKDATVLHEPLSTLKALWEDSVSKALDCQ